MSAVMNEFSTAALAADEMIICRLGQHSFLLRTNDVKIAFDPYLNDIPRRLIKPLIEAEELADFDLIFGSHDHSDHIDRPMLKTMSGGKVRFVFPRAVVNSIDGIDRDRIIAIDADESIEYKNIRINAIASAHEFLEYDEQGFCRNLGFIVSVGGHIVYHSGDCCVYDGLLSKLKEFSPDIVMLPINGRDARRYAANCIGNMTYQEAVDLAGMCNAVMVIPAHYDMFEGNTENVELFDAYVKVKYPHLASCILQPGAMIKVKAGLPSRC